MSRSAPNPAHVYGVSRRETSAHARRWATELLHEELSQADRSDEVRAAQHELDLEARRTAGGTTARAVGIMPDDSDDWTSPDVDVNLAHADWLSQMARAQAAHCLMPALRAADSILSPTALVAQAAHAHELIRTITPRREQLAALLRARLRAIAATLAAQLLPAPRSAATSAA